MTKYDILTKMAVAALQVVLEEGKQPEEPTQIDLDELEPGEDVTLLVACNRLPLFNSEIIPLELWRILLLFSRVKTSVADGAYAACMLLMYLRLKHPELEQSMIEVDCANALELALSETKPKNEKEDETNGQT